MNRYAKQAKKMGDLYKSRNFWLWAFAALAATYLLTFIVFVIIAALNKGIYFDGYAADGPFQMYNPLRRLEAGQIAGQDFPFFHGVGVPLLHFLPFHLLGGNVFASEVSRWLVSPMLFLVTSFVFFMAFLRSWRKSLIATAVVLVIAIKYVDVIYPSNSLIGVRTAFPMLVAAALLWQNSRLLNIGPFKIYLKHLLAILSLGLAFIFGTEQGLAAIIAYLVIRTFELMKASKDRKSALKQLVVEGCLTALACLIAITAATGGRPLHALVYSLLDIPKEQSWYFGSPPNSFLTWGNMWAMISTKPMLYVYGVLAAGLAAAAIFWRTKVVASWQRLPMVFLLLYGLFTCGTMLGYFAPTGQLIPLMRGSILVFTAILVAALWQPATWSLLSSKIRKPVRLGVLAGIVITSLAVATILVQTTRHTVASTRGFNIKGTLVTARIARNSPDSFASDPDWKLRLDSFAPYIQPGAVVWSTYSSLYESNAGIFHPSSQGYDYIIHALGPDNRDQYDTEFKKIQPQYVITLKPTYFLFEEWLWSKDWRFYEHLLTHYSLIKENGSHYLWRYNPQPAPQTETWKSLHATKNEYKLPANDTQDMRVLEVRVHYNASARLLLKQFNNLPRYLLTPKGTALLYAASLPSYENEWRFFVPLAPGQDKAKLIATAEGLLPSAKLEISDLSYRTLALTPENRVLFENNWCAIEHYGANKVCEDVHALPAEEAAKPLNARVPD